MNADVPLISDQTELISPTEAEEYLKQNKCNRPVNWRKVEEYSAIMKRGGWKLHSQGIIFDSDGNLLTGQQRLWAVVYSGVSVYFRVSRGNPKAVATLIDRGRPQSARDLATRRTEKKHSPTEQSIARAICVLRGMLRPSLDDLAVVIAENEPRAKAVLEETIGTAKTKGILMVLGAACVLAKDEPEARRFAKVAGAVAERLERELGSVSAARCWGKGAAFSLAMDRAKSILQQW